jgi:hypothetical protein
MKRWVTLLLAAVLLAGLGLGCGDKDKGVNSGQDKPKPADRGG